MDGKAIFAMGFLTGMIFLAGFIAYNNHERGKELEQQVRAFEPATDWQGKPLNEDSE